MAFDPTTAEPVEAEKPPFDPTTATEVKTEAKPAFDPTTAQPVTRTAEELAKIPHFNAPAHAAENPEEKEQAFMAQQILNNRTIGEKAASAGDILATGSTYTGALKGAAEFAGGLITTPLHTIAQAGLTAAAPALRAVGADNLADSADREATTEGAEALLAAQTIEQNLRNTGRALANTGGKITDAVTGAPYDEAADRKKFDDEIQAHLNQKSLESGRPIDTGAVAAISRAATGVNPSEGFSPEVLDQFGSRQASPAVVQMASAAGDPINLALPLAAKIPGVSTIAGGLVEGAGKAAAGLGTAMDYIPKVGTIAKQIGKPMTVAGTLALGAEAVAHPQVAAIAASAAALGKTLKFAGEGLAQQGEAMRTGIPSALDEAAQSAATAGRSALGVNAQRLIGNTAGHMVSTAVGFAPVNAAMSGGDADKFAQSEVGASVMGAMFALPGETIANRGQLQRVAAYRLAKDGAGQFTENPLYAAHQQQMAGFSPGDQGTINRLRSFLYRSTGTDVLVLPGAEYAKTVGEIGGDTRGHFAADPANKTIYINADSVSNQKAGGIEGTAGHEAGHAIVDYLKQAGQEGTANAMFQSIQSALTQEQMTSLTDGYREALAQGTKGFKNGTPEQQAAIRAQIAAANPDAQILEENLSEITRKILQGDDVSTFALPKPVLERITDAAGRALEKMGAAPIDHDSSLFFKAQMVKETARQMKDVLYGAGKKAISSIDEGQTVTQKAMELKAKIDGFLPITPDMPAAQAAAITRQKQAAEKELKALKKSLPKAEQTEAEKQDKAQQTADSQARKDAFYAIRAQNAGLPTSARQSPKVINAKLDLAMQAARDAGIPITTEELVNHANKGKFSEAAVPTPPPEPIAVTNKATFTDEMGNAMHVTGQAPAPEVGKYVTLRDGTIRRVSRIWPDGSIDIHRTDDALNSRPRGTVKEGEYQPVTHDYATPAQAAPGSVLPTSATPSTPTPQVPQIVPAEGGTFKIVDAAGNNLRGDRTFRTKSHAQRSIDQQGKSLELGNGPGGEWDILNHILDNGGIVSTTGSKEYDGMPSITGSATKIMGGTRTPDQMAQDLYEDNKLPDAYPDTLWDAIRDAIAARKSMKGQEASQKAEEARQKKESGQNQQPGQNGPAGQNNEQTPPTPNEPVRVSQLQADEGGKEPGGPAQPAPLQEADVATIAAQAEAAEHLKDENHNKIKLRKGERVLTNEGKKAVATAGINAVADAHAETVPLNYEGIRLRTDALGKQSITGNVNPGRPFDAFLLKMADISQEKLQMLLALQDKIGQTVRINYRHAEHTGMELTNEQRRVDQGIQTADQRAAGEVEGQDENKHVVPLEVIFNKGSDTKTPSFTVLCASPEKLLKNFTRLETELERLDAQPPYANIHDPALIEDMQGGIENHRNGWRFDGSARIKGTQLVKAPEPGDDYRPHVIDEDKAQFLNMLMGDESAKTGKRETAEQKTKQALAVENGIPMTEEGETNPMRDAINQLNKGLVNEKGEPTTWSKQNIENPLAEAIRPDLINEIHLDVDNLDDSIRPHGFSGDIASPFAKGQPNRTFVASGFLPESASADESVTPKPRIKDLVRDADTLGHIANSNTFREKGLNGLNTPRRRRVEGAVVRLAHDPEIFKAVVGRIPVDVMDYLRGRQLSPNGSLDDKTMEKAPLSGDSGFNIPARINVTSDIVTVIADAAAKVIRSTSDLPSGLKEWAVTKGAGDIRHEGTLAGKTANASQFMPEEGIGGYADPVHDIPQEQRDRIARQASAEIAHANPRIDDESERFRELVMENISDMSYEWARENPRVSSSAPSLTPFIGLSTAQRAIITKSAMQEAEGELARTDRGRGNRLVKQQRSLLYMPEGGDFPTSENADRPVRDNAIYAAPGKTIDVSEDTAGLPEGWSLVQNGGLWEVRGQDNKIIAASGSRQGTITQAKAKARIDARKPALTE